ncbi:lipoate--protein ligase family protein [Desulfurococcaceae archaeon MEX13E-LK6-19]|nr:lipoate--protein ligase family protein [Desulfurococcaceae archaeon MEX13E-LK6-19]
MAIDETMLILRDENKIPNTLRLYVFNPSAVTFGYFQRINDAVNVEYLLENNIGFTRRITGGGSVYHDRFGEITYSIVAPIDEIARDIQESYRIICQGIVYAIKEFGLDAVFKPVNDVIVNNKKISGSAQARKKNALLQHGTLMYNTDLDILAKCLKAPKKKLESHGVKSIRERVTTLSIELGRRVTKNEVINAMIKGFKKALGINELKLSTYTPQEIELATRLKEKYMSKEWIYKR